MNFYYNLRKIINILDCTNIELAAASNLDQTIISKFKNNIRIPTVGSKSFDYLINGICILTTRKNKTNEINELCGNEKDLYKNIYNYLICNSNDIRLNKEDYSLIGSNLEEIMKTFNISNVMLAKKLNKDGSLISKYKTGKRIILKNDKLVIQICDYFVNFIIKNNLQNDAYVLFNITEINKLKDAIFSFLFTEKKENSQINRLLGSINDYKFELLQNIPPVESFISNEIINSKNLYYIGINEFRNSIKRFLSNVCLADNPTTLYLYSDENMKWLFQNEDFYNTWKILMINCLIRHNKIKIIHNINRNTEEMFKAIESWLPLYMTGLIEPYYNIKTNNNFTHTLFIADHISTINSSSIICNKNYNVYYYSENNEVINNYKKQYFELLNNSKRLVKIYIGHDIIKKLNNKDSYLEYMIKDFNNIIIMIKKDETEVLILKNNSQKILFEFTYYKMIEIFIKYIKN